MPSLTTLLEDTSPLLVYSSNWRAGTSADDSSADKYTESSFTVTNFSGATMSLGFYGSSVTVYGARRGNHGNYSAGIDAIPSSTQNGSASPDEFNQVLYNANVSPGFHNLTITNDESTYFDIDYITIQSSIGLDNETILVNIFQDSHPSFNYTPSSSWTSPSYMIGSFEGGSGQYVVHSFSQISSLKPANSISATTDPSAAANFTFQAFSQLTFLSSSGDAVALYGPVGPNSSTFSVEIDNGRPSFFSANKQFYRSQQILFFAGNLGVGQHSLKVQPVAGPSMGELAIDYASVYTTPSLGGSFVGAVAAPPVSVHNNRSAPIAAIAGLAIAIPVSIIITLLLVWVFWLRHRRLGTKVQGNDRVSLPPENPAESFVQPFSLSSVPGPRPTNYQRSRMSQKLNPSPAFRGHTPESPLSASSSGLLYVSTNPSSSTSSRGKRTQPTSENSVITADGRLQDIREESVSSNRNDMFAATIPPPEYTQTLNSQYPTE